MEGQILFIMIIAHQASAYSTVNFFTDQLSWVITYLFILWAYWIVLAVGKMKIKLLMWRIFMNIINIMYIVMVISNNIQLVEKMNKQIRLPVTVQATWRSSVYGCQYCWPSLSWIILDQVICWDTSSSSCLVCFLCVELWLLNT